MRRSRFPLGGRSALPLVPALSAVLLLFSAGAQGETPSFLRDRGTGQPTSMFGTYVRAGELLFYPFFEYYLDDNLEYKPAELGHDLERDFRGRYRASEGLVFLCYGLTDWLAFELEAAVIQARLEKSKKDPSDMPEKIEESGTGDVEGQVRLRWLREGEERPELFSYFEAVSPQQREKMLIGTPDWEFKFGSGLSKGFPFGTLTGRAAFDYTVEDATFELGEYALEYLRRLSPSWRVYAGLEGSQDELSVITEAQLALSERVVLKLNSAFGVTSKATDWAPEAGIVFSFPVRMR